MRRTIAIILLVIAAAGLVYGILGATAQTIKLKNDLVEGVYDFSTDSYEGTMVVTSANGLAMDKNGLRKLAKSTRDRQQWIGFGTFAVLSIVGIALLIKRRRHTPRVDNAGLERITSIEKYDWKNIGQ